MNKLMRDVFDAIQADQAQKQQDVNIDANTDDLIESDLGDTWIGKVLLMAAFIVMVFILCVVGN